MRSYSKSSDIHSADDELMSLWLIALVLTILAVCCYYIIRGVIYHWAISLSNDQKAIWRSRLLIFFGKRLNCGIRNQFQREFEYHPKDPMVGHSHGESAAERTSASNSIKRWITSSGFKPFVVSTSSRDGEDCDGFHQVYMAKDIVHKARDDPVTENHMIAMIDVDYHVDMHHWLSFGRPIVAYTFVPTSVGGTVPDGHFTIVNNYIDYHVNGGAHYNHPIWNYSDDFLIAEHWWGSTVFSVETRHVTATRRIVILTPEYQVRGILSWLMRQTATVLKHCDFLHSSGLDTAGDERDVNCLFTTKAGSGELLVSVGIAGQYQSVTITDRLYRSLLVRYHGAKNPDMLTIGKYLRAEGVPDPDLVAPLFWDCLHVISSNTGDSAGARILAGSVQNLRPDNYVVVGTPGAGYLPIDTTPILAGRNVAPSLVKEPAVVAASSYNNDLACIHGRIGAVYNNTKWTGRIASFADEFLHLLVPDKIAGTLDPVDPQYIIEQQKNPHKRGRLATAVNWVSMHDSLFVKAFCKKETYGKITHPRNISTVGAAATILMGCFTDAFKISVLLLQNWYMPCKSPSEVAIRLQEFCCEYDGVTETDFSKFDGSQSISMALFVRSVYLRAFHQKHRTQIMDLWNNEILAKGRTTHGVPYRAAGTRLSGSKLTTDGNTILAALVDFISLRLGGLTAPEAWERLGLYAGDDGVSCCSPKYIEMACKQLGLGVKAIYRQRGDFVMFLGRLFLDPWETLWSIQDPMRTWMKLHISFAPDMFSPALALYNRARGYLDLDEYAPITSDWCRTVLRLAKPDVTAGASIDVDVPWYVRLDRVCESGSWPSPPSGHSLAIQRVAESTGFDSSKIREWQTTIQDAKTLDELYQLIPNERPVPDVGADIVNTTDMFSRIDVGTVVPQRDVPDAKSIRSAVTLPAPDTPANALQGHNRADAKDTGSRKVRVHRGRNVYTKRSSSRCSSDANSVVSSDGPSTSRAAALRRDKRTERGLRPAVVTPPGFFKTDRRPCSPPLL